MSAEANPRAKPTAPRRGSTPAASSPALDYQLIAIVATFLALGLVMVFSASFARAGTYFFVQQLKWVGVGLVTCVVATLIPYRVWQYVSIPLMVAAVLALGAVLAFGGEQFGATRTFGGRFQPSELAKLAVAIYVAAWVTIKGRHLDSFQEGLLPFAIIMGLVATLIILERSFSVTIITVTIGLAIFFVGGGNVRQMLIVLAIATPILVLAMWKSGYPFQRIENWWAILFNPDQAPTDMLRIIEMLRAGRGIGMDPATWQEKALVPALWSDYLFANIGADLHFPGTVAVVALYAWFGYRGLGIALNARDRFGSLLAIGLTAWILIQAAIHIGTSLALIPVTGQPLPFMSYGGSSLVSCMMAAGLLLSISRASTEKKPAYAHFAFGWRNWRPRLSRPSRRQRPEGAGRTARTASAKPVTSRRRTSQRTRRR